MFSNAQQGLLERGLRPVPLGYQIIHRGGAKASVLVREDDELVEAVPTQASAVRLYAGHEAQDRTGGFPFGGKVLLAYFSC